MADMQSHTEVEVVVNPKVEEMYGPWSMDPQARSRALHMLLQAFRILGPQIKGLEPSADESKLVVKYSEANTDRLCWQFGQYGYCPRGPSCRWDHVALETFIITIVMQPLAMDMSPVAMPAPASTACHFGELPNGELPGGMVGYVIAAPMPTATEQVPGMMMMAIPVQQWVPPNDAPGPLPCAVEVPTSGQAEPEPERSGSASPTSPSETPKTRTSRVCWADIEDDEPALIDDCS